MGLSWGVSFSTLVVFIAGVPKLTLSSRSGRRELLGIPFRTDAPASVLLSTPKSRGTTLNGESGLSHPSLAQRVLSSLA